MLKNRLLLAVSLALCAVLAGAYAARPRGPDTVRDVLLTPTKTTGEVTELGVTVWQVRPVPARDDRVSAASGVDTERLVERLAEREQKVSAGRADANQTFTRNDLLRLTLEPLSRDGFIYILDQESYADGSYSPPHLIFPLYNRDDNRARRGRLIELPTRQDSNALQAFNLKSAWSKANYTGERLAVIFAPRRIEELEEARALASGTVKIRPELLEKWAAQWFRPDAIRELTDPPARLPQQGHAQPADPSPTTIYRIAAGPEKPILFYVNLTCEL